MTLQRWATFYKSTEKAFCLPDLKKKTFVGCYKLKLLIKREKIEKVF